MNLETIIKLFHKAEAQKLYYTDPVAAQRVAQMIADAENEACAKVGKDVLPNHPDLGDVVANHIRARGQA